MDRTTPVTLVAEDFTENEFGVLTRTTSEREIYADVQSVGAKEWFEGGRNGLNPEYKLRVFGPDYNGEEIVKIFGKAYTIYRTYQTRTDTLELYVERKQGNAGVGND